MKESKKNNSDEIHFNQNFTTQNTKFDDTFKINKKILFIGGGNANFTCVKKTFVSILKAIEKFSKDTDLFQNTEVWIRRAGPNYREAFKIASNKLNELNIRYRLFGPELPITEIVRMALPPLNNSQSPSQSVQIADNHDTITSNVDSHLV